ncbi:TonB-dependent receptor domain-containing protein [Chitinophaga barathri]|uniref:TonB-dependent receptor n=1 Tax=Chitinophaga barathri TaxID=1647451 RepID=A0A3N4MEW9_9BACT|nr:outer membrane beta-barrel family protein [Chitinophaga barathri]RPD42148.1 TonB-dependent receptor [Chitinophaga barathri]
MSRLYSIVWLFLLSAATAGAQTATISGQVKDAAKNTPLPIVNVTLLRPADSVLITGSITNEEGRFSIPSVKKGNYLLKLNYLGYVPQFKPLLVGELSAFLDLGQIDMQEDVKQLSQVEVTAKQEAIAAKMDKKTFTLANNISQSGGSAMEAMKNLPGITVGQDGKIQLRGSDKVMVLINGQQTALTGFGGQSGLENISASSIEKIEIINNPSARYDANGNAGIINIIFKKEKKDGFNGKVGLTAGLGALWVKKENLPDIRPQYQRTPKINPSLSLNYRKNKVNFFLQADDLYTETLNKNEFVDRYYDNGDTVRQQTKRNRNTNFATVKTGLDWFVNDQNTLTVSGLFSSEKIIDHGDEPFFNGRLSERDRLWQFLEDEIKTTATASAIWQHKFRQPGRLLNAAFNYTFHREDEQYYFKNINPSFTGVDSFKLLSDEHVADFTLDYIQPLKHGRLEGGLKFRRRYIPTNMQFIPGVNSPLDTNAGGWANYGETIPAVYGNYVLESNKFEVEAGLRLEYVRIQYDVNPEHSTYKSDGYHYTQPFPNLRLAYKIDPDNKISLFYSRRVDRPNEVDIRIFPKYDDVEIIKVGNPALRPQFTNSFEAGYKTSWPEGYFYVSLYHKRMDATITRIGSTVPGSNLIYNIFQNAGHSYNTGSEIIISHNFGKLASLNLNLNGYRHIIDAFTVVNKYPVENTFTAEKQDMFAGNVKLNGLFHLGAQTDLQFSAIYLSPDIIPQGEIGARFSIDMGVKKIIQKGKGELILNATDIANTLRIKRTVNGEGFRYISTDYYETQVIRLGYGYKF